MPREEMKKSSSIVMALALILLSALSSEARVLGPGLQSAMPSLSPHEAVPVIVYLSDKVNLELFKDRKLSVRRAKLLRALKGKAGATQKPLKAFLKGRGARSIVPLWAVNAVAVTIPVGVIPKLAEFPGVERIRLDVTLRLPETVIDATSTAPEWNIDVVKAPELWDMR
jgi:hypothetical protein